MTTLDLLRSTEPGLLREWAHTCDSVKGGLASVGYEHQERAADVLRALAEHHAEIVAALKVAEAVAKRLAHSSDCHCYLDGECAFTVSLNALRAAWSAAKESGNSVVHNEDTCLCEACCYQRSKENGDG